MGKYKDTPRYNVISMRVTDVERQVIQEIAADNDVSISNMMRLAMERYAAQRSSTGAVECALR